MNFFLSTGAARNFLKYNLRNREYCMVAWGYEFYLRVLKVSLTSEGSERVRDTFSTSGKVAMQCSVYFIDTDEITT